MCIYMGKRCCEMELSEDCMMNSRVMKPRVRQFCKSPNRSWCLSQILWLIFRERLGFVVLDFKPMTIETGSTSESFGNFGDADSWYQYQPFDTESWGWSPSNWYFPVQMCKISQWFSYIASIENHCSVGLHSLGWKGRKTTYNLSVVWETFI